MGFLARDHRQLLWRACSVAVSALPTTLQRIEAGDANVGIGIYASVLQALGLLDGLAHIADIGNDSVGQALSSAELPRRVVLKRSPRSSSND